MRKKLIQALEHYGKSAHIWDQEKSTLDQFISFVSDQPTCFDRSNMGHVTGSAWIVNHDASKALLTHHRKLRMWLQLGGHADGDPDIAAVAHKEAQEESGINHFTFLIKGIFDISIHPIPSACAYHYDVRYLLQAPKDASLRISEESLDLAWVDVDNISQFTSQNEIHRMNKKCLSMLR